MPIYEYLCNSCGVRKEHIQKMSDAPISTCAACGSAEYIKLISAAGFQLKGSGWYVTDFKNKPAATKSEKNDTLSQSTESKADTQTASKASSKADTTPPAAKSTETKASATTSTATD